MNLEKLVGQTLDGKYLIERELGRGGMGTVYLALHLGTERAVAVKVIAPQFMRRTEFVERFRREARAAGRLRHPNVVDVTDFGFAETEIGAVAYLVMEYLDGCTLGEILEEEKQLPLNWSLDILEQVCSAVHEAHGQGIIHRDLKPDNIWLEPNQRGGYTVKVLDFGIAKLEEHPHHSEESENRFIGNVSPDEFLAESGNNLKATTEIGRKDGRLTEVANAVRQSVVKATENKTILTDFNNSNTFIGESVANLTQSTEEENGATLNQLIESIDKDLTALAENQTLASDAESQTLIQNIEENGTQLFPVANDGQKTVILTEEKNGATKILHENSTHAETAKSLAALKSSAEISGLSNRNSTEKFALSSHSGASLTQVGAVLGTPLYMSPEQCRGEKLDARADIYALGIIAYQMLAGNTPFSGTYTEVMKAHCDDLPPALKVKKVPRRVKQIIASAIEKTPEKRPPTALIFASQLRAHSEGVGTLLRKSLVMWGEYLPTFLWVTFLLWLPMITVTFLHLAVQFLMISGVVPNFFGEILNAFISLLMLFVGIVSGSVITGIITLIVAQLLAVPLRPITWQPAFKLTRKNWRKWTWTISRSSLITFFGFIFGFPLGIALYVHWLRRDFRTFYTMLTKPQEPNNAERWRKFGESLSVKGIIKAVGLVIIVFSGFYWSVRYALVSPILMMENLSGGAALKRSAELTKRSYWIAVVIVLLHVLFPAVLSVVTIAVANSLVILNDKDKPAISGKNVTPAKPKVAIIIADDVPQTAAEASATVTAPENPAETAGNKQERYLNAISMKLKEAIYQILWLPISFFVISFSAVNMALLYLKTRQSGGQSLKELLSKFESERPQSKWQLRVKEKLAQSGRTSSNG